MASRTMSGEERSCRGRGNAEAGTPLDWPRPGCDFRPSLVPGLTSTGELALESYYKVAFNKHVALVQDFQFLHHPGGVRTNRDCPVITPRLVISF